MMPSDNKLKHLEFIEAAINRMASNSFLLKGWSVTLVAALFALAAKDANRKYVVIAYLPVIVFWIIDAYFLSNERLFRDLYDCVRRKRDDEIDFSMDTTPFEEVKNSWGAALFSWTLVVFYLSFVIIMLGVRYFIQ